MISSRSSHSEENKTMESNNCLKADCPNWGTLVIDANVVRYVLRGTIQIVADTYVDCIWPQRLPNVKASFKNNLEIIKKCSSDNKLQTSQLVLNELDAHHISGSSCPLNRSRSVYSLTTLQELVQVIHGCFCDSIITTQQESIELQNILRSHDIHLKDHDTSLILAACKATQQEAPTIIVSSDSDFIKPCEILSQLGSIDINGALYHTDKLMLRIYPDFMTKFHQCCSCSSPVYRPLFNAWFYPLLKLASYGSHRRAQQRVGEMMNSFLTAHEAMQDSLENKGSSSI